MKTYFFTVIILIAIIGFSTVVGAATIVVVTPQQAVSGSIVTVDIVADTEGQSINAADITLSYPAELLRFSGVKKDKGIITLWVVPPHEIAPGVVSFSGVVPGGVERNFDPQHSTDTSIILAQLLFTPLAAGSATIAVDQVSLLKNDGTGNALSVLTTPGLIPIATGSGVVPSDTGSPSPFTIMMLEKSTFGKTPRLAVFSSTDDDIEHYEARINKGAWRTVTSPYPIPSKVFGFTLTIRAVDFAGNTTDQSIAVIGERGSAQRAVAGLCALLVIVLILYTRTKRRRIQ